MIATLVWGALDWLAIAAGLGLFLLILLVLGYRKAPASPSVRVVAGALKALGILILLLCLLDPLISSQRARPGANQFVLLADNSQSMTLKDGAGARTRGEELKESIPKEAPWLSQLAKDFDLRQFAFDAQLRAIESIETLPFDGRTSDLGTALDRLLRRYAGHPLAGILLLTDGSATDAESLERVLSRNAPDPNNPTRAVIPPIYPVLYGRSAPPTDISVERLDVTQTNFEDAPVTLAAQIMTAGYRGRTLIAELLDEAGKSLEQQKVRVEQDGEPVVARFRFKPETQGVSFYRVRVAAADGAGAGFEPFEKPELSTEATLANNGRMAVVDRGRGPYRILYIAGRPNWEFKFLQRALASEDQTQLVGFLRVAKREPKFNFLARGGEAINPLFSGFDNKDRETAENYDQPVIIRLGTLDQEELKEGFPKVAEDLFKYHAIIVDDHAGPDDPDQGFRAAARGRAADAGRDRNVPRREIRPHTHRRPAAGLHRPGADEPARCKLPDGADSRRVAGTVAAVAGGRGDGTATAVGDAGVSDAEPDPGDQAGGDGTGAGDE
jgi:hypothetical protein